MILERELNVREILDWFQEAQAQQVGLTIFRDSAEARIVEHPSAEVGKAAAFDSFGGSAGSVAAKAHSDLVEVKTCLL